MRKKEKENIIEIKEEVKILQKDEIITLEKGDKIKILDKIKESSKHAIPNLKADELITYYVDIPQDPYDYVDIKQDSYDIGENIGVILQESAIRNSLDPIEFIRGVERGLRFG